MLVGHEAELARLAELLDSRWLVTLTGAPGVGKSRLAVELSSYLGPPAPVAAVVALGSLRDPAAVGPAVAGALGVGDLSRQALDALVAAAGERGVVVVVLDDCDWALDATGEAAWALGAAGVLVVATCQRPLGLDGEMLCPVRPLSLPHHCADAVPEVLERSEAVRLFCERARSVECGFALTADTAPAVAEICCRLDGLPLAIELAAAWAFFLSPGEILAYLGDPLRFLAKSRQLGGHRYAGLRAAFDWSFELLAESERTLLRWLSVFEGAFTLPDAEEVAGAEELEGRTVLEVLGALVERSLVVAEVSAVTSRYRLLQTVRAYGRERLRDTGDYEAAKRRHAAWCVKLVTTGAYPFHGDSGERRDVHDDVSAALDWAVGVGEAESALRLAHARLVQCRARGQHAKARAAVEAVLPLCDDAPASLRAQGLRDGGRLALDRGELPLAHERLGKARAAAREAGDTFCEVQALSTLGLVCVLRGDPTGSLQAMEPAVALARRGGDARALSAALAASGHAHLLMGETAAAEDHLTESEQVAARAGRDDAMASALVGLGTVALRRADYARAERLLGRGLDAARAVFDTPTATEALAELGEAARLRDEYERAQCCFADCEALAREAAIPYPLGRALLGMGRLARARGDLDRANACAEEALGVGRLYGLPYLRGSALAALGELAHACNDIPRARALLVDALNTARRCHDRPTEASALDELGRVARTRERRGRALARHRHALALHQDTQDHAGLAGSIEALAGLAADGKNFAAAARLFGAAQGIRDARGCPGPAAHRERGESDERVVRQALGEHFDTHWQAGKALSADDAVASAMGRRHRRPWAGWNVLTPAERRVAELAGDGLSNAAIAERLTLSRRTVETHLHNIFTKLDIDSRADLATASLRSPAPTPK